MQLHKLSRNSYKFYYNKTKNNCQSKKDDGLQLAIDKVLCTGNVDIVKKCFQLCCFLYVIPQNAILQMVKVKGCLHNIQKTGHKDLDFVYITEV